MKKEFRNLTVVLGIYLIIISSGLGFFGSADDFLEEDQIQLVYDVLEWEEGPLGTGVEWSYSYPPVYKGNFSSNVGGKFEILITGYHEKNVTYEAWEDIENVSYGDISIFKKVEGNYELNFTLSNISMNEIGNVLVYGFIGWNPAFNSSTDWRTNARFALNKTDLGFTEVNVSISADSSIVVYDFKQMDGFEQMTTLVYNKSSGILLEAVTSVGLYKSHIRLQGYTPSQQTPEPTPAEQIPGYMLPLLLVSILFGIYIVHQKKRRNNSL
jgi:hypothetical protein